VRRSLHERSSAGRTSFAYHVSTKSALGRGNALCHLRKPVTSTRARSAFPAAALRWRCYPPRVVAYLNVCATRPLCAPPHSSRPEKPVGQQAAAPGFSVHFRGLGGLSVRRSATSSSNRREIRQGELSESRTICQTERSSICALHRTPPSRPQGSAADGGAIVNATATRVVRGRGSHARRARRATTLRRSTAKRVRRRTLTDHVRRRLGPTSVG
jgi:hypothetical protein